VDDLGGKLAANSFGKANFCRQKRRAEYSGQRLQLCAVRDYEAANVSTVTKICYENCTCKTSETRIAYELLLCGVFLFLIIKHPFKYLRFILIKVLNIMSFVFNPCISHFTITPIQSRNQSFSLIYINHGVC
jgi:hypothetical protein